MPVELEDAKRTAIAMQLAEMKAVQNLLILTEQRLMNEVNDDSVHQQLQNMLEQDQKNLGVLDTVMIQYGVQAELKDAVKQNLERTRSLIEGSKLTPSEKLLQHELLKHRQTMAGLIIHKAAQIVGADVEVAIAPLHTINFENRAHQEQLKGSLEILGVLELTGQEPDQGVQARTEDAITAFTGVVGSVVTRTDDEMSIRDVLLMDHSKTDILFAEVLGNNDPQKIREYFGQLYQDVKVHGLAEEQVLYPALSPYYDQMQEIVDQTDHVIELLNKMKSFNPANPNFKAQVEQLRLAVRGHIDQEERDIFPRIKDNLSSEQQKTLATDFKAAKSNLQEQQQEQKTFSPPQPSVSPSNSSYQAKSWLIFMNNTIPWKLVFQTKAVINWIEAVILLVGDRWIREALNTEPLVNTEYSQLVYGLVFIIGIGYWWVSQDITKNDAIIKLGIYAQFSVFTVLAYHTLFGNLHPFYLVSGVIDLTFGILFVLYLYLRNHAEENIQTKEI
ncbi:hemerythrin domain-containing protein [Leptolyngbya sp. FACHB-36]|uniref:hemerythrin domain-containing protein n=1 Tax=Leptolyngbya sp. FACHB-36 TaxID=2692808 RepID=UPI001681B441|nr:hemerythrin domain-containing protein [Leptolyngbya sp. FACHB-36]MBD2020980.1 hemerythrin domain-containing protein [Leptolyngbya sp. FACHB-36]